MQNDAKTRVPPAAEAVRIPPVVVSLYISKGLSKLSNEREVFNWQNPSATQDASDVQEVCRRQEERL